MENSEDPGYCFKISSVLGTEAIWGVNHQVHNLCLSSCNFQINNKQFKKIITWDSETEICWEINPSLLHGCLGPQYLRYHLPPPWMHVGKTLELGVELGRKLTHINMGPDTETLKSNTCPQNPFWGPKYCLVPRMIREYYRRFFIVCGLFLQLTYSKCPTFKWGCEGECRRTWSSWI